MSEIWSLVFRGLTSDVWFPRSSDITRLMSVVRFLMFYFWCLMFDVRRLISDVWCMTSWWQTSDVWFVMSDIWCLVSDIRRLTSCVWCLMSDVWCTIYDVWCRTDVWYLISAVCHRDTGNFLPGEAVDHLLKNFSQVAQIVTKRTVEKKRGPYDATMSAVLAYEGGSILEQFFRVNTSQFWA